MAPWMGMYSVSMVVIKMVKHDHNDKYVKREVCEEKHKNITSKTEEIDRRLKHHSDSIDRINAKITGSLVFSIATLLTLIIALVTGRI